MISLILLAGGSSSRFGGNKMKALLGGIPIFLHSLIKFYKNPKITEIIIICKEDDIEDYKLLQKQFPKIKHVILGGNERQFSVQNGIKYVSNEITLIHNGANPLVTDSEINDVIDSTEKYGASAPGMRSKNTLKKVDKEGFVIETINRDDIWEMQTPQGVDTKKFKELNQNKTKTEDKTPFTDDVSFFEKAGLQVKIVQASEQNFKITTQEDLLKAQNFVKQDLRIGIGHDSHRFGKPGEFIVLGGVQVPFNKGLEGNSDGDVLIHAICNAIGTAIGEGSLSLYSDEMCKKGIKDSSEYLKYIMKMMKSKGYIIGNISASIEALQPKLEKHILSMKQKLSELLECTVLQIGIACTSGENLTDFGKGLGIQCFVNVILKKT